MPIIPRPTMLAETKLGVIYSHLPVPPPACAVAVEVAAPSGMDARKRGGRPWCSLKRSPCEFEERYNGKPPHSSSSSSSDAARMKAKGVVHEKEKEKRERDNGLIIDK